ncbi:hypothetical protein [Mesorhizobium sp. LNHC252B00]|uniref:hypothetical protein n=1 Tax=Mesorhizobium sp. LNHC252B00 TaxID=1287252 RepID=UPI0012EBD1B0|nr:hypothetical protein [Mesorhizobium sp. LNHC252B00]
MSGSSARFQLKEINDGGRHLSEKEKESVRGMLLGKIARAHMGDGIIPDRKIYAPMVRNNTRLLEGCLGIQGPSKGTWTEEMFDVFFGKHFVGGCYLWVEPPVGHIPDPIFWAPYSPARRDWLYIYASNLGMRPCGMMRVDGRLAVYANLDCDFTFVFGDDGIIKNFDKAFGGREKICEEFNKFLDSNEVDLGEGNIYAFMKLYLPEIEGCT